MEDRAIRKIEDLACLGKYVERVDSPPCTIMAILDFLPYAVPLTVTVRLKPCISTLVPEDLREPIAELTDLTNSHFLTAIPLEIADEYEVILKPNLSFAGVRIFRVDRKVLQEFAA